MDTSNNQKRPVDHLLGSKFSQGQFTQEDWVRILSSVIENVGPQLKYLAGMCDPKEIFNKYIGRLDISFPEGLLGQLHPDLIAGPKCMILCSFNFDPLMSEPVPVPPSDQLYYFYLILTTNKKFFRVFATYKRLFENDIYPIRCSTSSIVATPVELQELDMTRETKTPFDLCVAAVILNSFYTAFKQTIEAKHRHLDSMLKTQGEIREKMKFLDVFNGRFES